MSFMLLAGHRTVIEENNFRTERGKAFYFSQPKQFPGKRTRTKPRACERTGLPQGQPREEAKETCTYQSVEAHRATACSPVFMFCSISPSTSEDWMRTTIWLMTEDSLRIRPMTTHQSRHPASMKMCSKYLQEQNRKFEAQKVLRCRKGRSSSGK